MKTIVATLLLILGFGIDASYAQTGKAERIFQTEDQRIAEEKMQTYTSKSNLPVEELIVEIGLSFLGTPYVAATLENGLEEKLVINLREMDCTTFAENCLALARTLKEGKTDFESFVLQLEKIRYRDGLRNQYPSRLHYFSEWIHNNHQKRLIDESVNKYGKRTGKAIIFMSTHPNSYPVLKEHPELISVIANQEKEITHAEMYFFPKNDLQNLYRHLNHGDIVGLTSTIEGLDVNHVGIIIFKNNEFHLLHASQSEKKVVVSDSPITDFLKPQSKNGGIMIARPIFAE